MSEDKEIKKPDTEPEMVPEKEPVTEPEKTPETEPEKAPEKAPEKKPEKKPEKTPATPKAAKADSAKDNVIKKPLLSEAAIKRIKGLIAPVVITLIILGVVLFILNFKDNSAEEAKIEMYSYEGGEEPIIMENDKIKFTMNPLTTAFDVEVKSTGAIWHSIPEEDAIKADVIVNEGTDEYNRLHSQLLLTYSNDSGAETKYNTFKNSIENSTYNIEVTSEYVKVMYTLGTMAKEYKIPPVLTVDTRKQWFDAIKASVEDADIDSLSGLYKKYDINNPRKSDDVEDLKANYPLYETEVIYILDPNTKERFKKVFAEYFEKAGYTDEQYEADKQLSLKTSSSKTPPFNVSVYYRLDGDDLIVEIPYNEIAYNNMSKNPLYTLTPLPYFGAGTTDDRGFMMIPEGGGAVIEFNNGKSNYTQKYYSNVYGWDMGIVRKEVIHETRSSFNCYGISKGKNSVLCILEDGASYGYVNADVAGRDNSFNFVNTTYNIVPREQYDVGSIADRAVYVYLPEIPNEALVQRYRFIDSGSYVDMANDYREYLKSVNPEAFAAKSTETSAPVVVEIVAAADKMKQILGVPTKKPLKLTTFKEAKEMITQLNGEGVTNMSVKLSGWANGGVNQKIMKKVKLVSSCGSKSDLKKLSQEAKNLGIDLYLDGVTQYEYNSKLWDGFNSFTDAARFISRERAELFQYSKVTYVQREGSDSYYLLHADLATKIANTLFKTAQKYDANVSFREIGKDLSGDYYVKKTTTREASKKNEAAMLEEMSKTSKVMINNGNAYAAIYSDVITNMDFHGSECSIIDSFIPFYQIALHGYKNYAGEAINLSANPEKELLLSAEYGAGLYFTFMKESPFALQKTLYDEYFGASYDSWHDRMLETYQRYNREMGHVFNQEIVGHEVIGKDLTCTTYEDGTKVYVNYGFEDQEADGKRIPARDYFVTK